MMSTILIVDDDLDSAEIVAKALRRSGHRAMCAPNGREALALLTGALPDLIVLDMRMPEMDGLTFLQVLRSYLRWRQLPVIVLTAYAEGPHIQQAANLDATEVFRKGQLDLNELVAAVEDQLRNQHYPGTHRGGDGMAARPPSQ